MFRVSRPRHSVPCRGAGRTTILWRVVAAAVGFVALSATTWASTVVASPRTISSLTVRGDFAVLYFAPAVSLPPEGCSGVNATLAVVVDVSQSTGDKALFAAALAAFHAGSTVGFVVDGCGPDDLPRAIQINVQP